MIEERAHVQLRVKKMQQLAQTRERTSELAYGLGSTSQHTCTCIGCERIAAELEGSKEGGTGRQLDRLHLREMYRDGNTCGITRLI